MDKQTFIDSVSNLLAHRKYDKSTSFIVCLNNGTEILADYYEFEEYQNPVKWVRLYRTDRHTKTRKKKIRYPIAVVKLQDIDKILDHSNWC